MNYTNKRQEIALFINELHEKGLFVGMNNADTMSSYVLAKNSEYTATLGTDDLEAQEKALSVLSSAVAMYNDFARCTRISQLMELGPKAGMEEFLSSELTVTGFGFEQEKNPVTGAEFTKLKPGKSVNLKPIDYIRVVCEKEVPRIRDLVRIFAHKMIEFDTHGDTAIDYAGMSASYHQLLNALKEKNPVWGTPQAELSKAKLSWMLQDIVTTMTFGVVAEMRSTDVGHLQKSAFATGFKADAGATTTVKGAETLINEVFFCAYMRKNNKSYKWLSKDKVDSKSAESLVSNQVMAEPKTKPQATPKAGEVTSTVESAPAEKPKKSGKKSAKKATKPVAEVPQSIAAGDKVSSPSLGEGIVTETTDTTLSVDFGGETKKFKFPSAFADGFLVKK